MLGTMRIFCRYLDDLRIESVLLLQEYVRSVHKKEERFVLNYFL